MKQSVLVAGIGNVFMRDDGFGVEVAKRLAMRKLPQGVRVADFGIKGVHLAYELLDGYDRLILLDAVPMGEPPGTLALIEPSATETPRSDSDNDGELGNYLDAHVMSPEIVLATLSRLGGSLEEVVVLGCQPGSLEEGMGLTAEVEGALEAAVDLCIEVLEQMTTPINSSRKGTER